VNANWIGHVLCRKCFQHVVEEEIKGRIEVMRRRGRRSKQVLDDLMEERRYWKLNKGSVDPTLWRTSFGRGCGPADCGMNECLTLSLLTWRIC